MDEIERAQEHVSTLSSELLTLQVEYNTDDENIDIYNRIIRVSGRLATALLIASALGSRKYGRNSAIIKLAEMYRTLPPPITSVEELASVAGLDKDSFDVAFEQMRLSFTRTAISELSIDSIDEAFRDDSISLSEYEYFMNLVAVKAKASSKNAISGNIEVTVSDKIAKMLNSSSDAI